MRKVSFLFGFALALFFSLSTMSCSKEDLGNGEIDDIINGIIDDEEYKNGDDFIELTLKGKTYREKANQALYLQIDPVGYDGNNALTYTYNPKCSFEEYGFEFLYGIVHYRDRDELLKSQVGNYTIATFQEEDRYYKNLVFDPGLYLDEVDYMKTKNGVHQVTSIKNVKGKVQICGKFSCTVYDGNLEQKISGSYQLTIPF